MSAGCREFVGEGKFWCRKNPNHPIRLRTQLSSLGSLRPIFSGKAVNLAGYFLENRIAKNSRLATWNLYFMVASRSFFSIKSLVIRS